MAKKKYKRKKKSYNPFKMWGSYVIPTIVLLILVIMYFYYFDPLRPSNLEIAWIYPISISIMGFLIGWAIHNLFRRARK